MDSGDHFKCFKYSISTHQISDFNNIYHKRAFQLDTMYCHVSRELLKSPIKSLPIPVPSVYFELNSNLTVDPICGPGLLQCS